MYETILMPLDESQTDRPIIEHVRALATVMHSRVVLLHVVSGPQAEWNGPDAAGAQVEKTRRYLDGVRAELEAASVPARVELAFGDPAKEIVRWVQHNPCELVAMGTHGHRWLSDMVLGFTASRVQHAVSVPVLLLRSR
ncbi:MAG TPA: universal stress protein [Candidatus Polarisedimenticolaceae bacterium]|nr:universal stress protein [Candidatus Polarisedimenticolaceae bacterium]